MARAGSVTVGRHTRLGYWLAEAGGIEAQPALREAIEADVCIVGGGFLGLWTAWFLAQQQPGLELVLLEAELCGRGPSGRNAGIAHPVWAQMPALRSRFGDEQALALGLASADSVIGIGEWCESQVVDAWYEPHPLIEASVAPSQDERWAAAVAACAEFGVADAYSSAGREELGAHFDSDRVRGGAIMRPGASLQPARLANALRGALLDRGVSIFENSPVVSRRDDARGVLVETGSGAVRAQRCVLAVNTALAGWPGFRRRLSVTSSHMLITEPAPDVLEAHGWEGAPVTDHRTLLHYFRATPDRRIALGWGGGPMAFGGRIAGRLEIDRFSIGQAMRGLRFFFPELSGSDVAHAWGGPIAVSPIRVPIFGREGATCFGYGFTGNGVALTHLGGRTLADLALDRSTALTRLPNVNPSGLASFPPEPLRYIGASLIRQAMIRRDRAEAGGRTAGRLSTLIADLPRRFGMNLPR